MSEVNENAQAVLPPFPEVEPLPPEIDVFAAVAEFEKVADDLAQCCLAQAARISVSKLCALHADLMADLCEQIVGTDNEALLLGSVELIEFMSITMADFMLLFASEESDAVAHGARPQGGGDSAIVDQAGEYVRSLGEHLTKGLDSAKKRFSHTPEATEELHLLEKLVSRAMDRVCDVTGKVGGAEQYLRLPAPPAPSEFT